MRVLENKIPPPIVMALSAILMFGLSKLGFMFEVDSLIKGALIVSLFLLGVSFALGGILSFKKAETTVNPLKPDSASSLVDSGIYQITRNPMYVGLTIILASWGVYLSSWLSLTLVPIFLFYINHFQILPEERALERIFGEEYLEYKSKVRRWL